tara:strand:- start:7493 stop:8608 length:1116 start_codon:yes stop_codon:yes gene_type:complete
MINSRGRFEALDYARFFCALSVVFFHYTFNGIVNGKIETITALPPISSITQYGYLGVEFFFMVSGYVIFISATNRSASKFAVSRAVRLFPSYWFAVLFTAVFALWLGGNSKMSVTIPQVIANLTMIQQAFGFEHVDSVYWTLMYELMFYMFIFIIIFMGLQSYLKKIFLAWPLFILILVKGFEINIPLLSGYYSYFAAGAIFAILKSDKSNVFAWTSVIITFYLSISFSIVSLDALSLKKQVYFSPYIVTAIISLFFIFFCFINTEKGAHLKLPYSQSIGALTYPLYLIHLHVGYLIINEFSGSTNFGTVVSFTLGFVLFVSLFMNKIVENYFSNIWKKLFNSTLGYSIELCSKIKKKILYNVNIKYTNTE